MVDVIILQIKSEIVITPREYGHMHSALAVALCDTYPVWDIAGSMFITIIAVGSDRVVP